MGTLRILRLDRSPTMGDWWLAFAAADTEDFYEAVTEVRALGSQHARWDPGARAWCVSTAALPQLARRLPALAAWIADEQHERVRDSARTGKREKSGKKSRRSHRTSSSTATSSVPSAVESAFATLYVQPDAPLSVVKAAYRALARDLHPDVGGDTEGMKRLNSAVETAGKWAEEHSDSRTARAGAYTR